MEVALLSFTPLALDTLRGRHLCQFSLKDQNPSKAIRPKGTHEVYAGRHVICSSDLLAQDLSGERSSLVLGKRVEKKSGMVLPDDDSLSALLLYYANNGLLYKALEVWDEMLNSSFVPKIELISELIFIYGTKRDFDTVMRILHQVELKYSKLLPNLFNMAISNFGKIGQLDCMEFMIKQMVSMGYSINSTIGNAYVIYYSAFGTLTAMEVAYGRLKRSRVLIEEEAIRAVSFAYIKENKFYALGRFVQDVGLARKNVGNLLWNLLLLSYAANFKMKSLQREFVRMVESGFNPDVNTFNIRLLAFSKMSLFWDLHLSLEHMKHEAVVPDLVTYGCVVDAYLDRKLGKNLEFSLSNLNWDDPVTVLTDPHVFMAMGKGEFHLSSEAILEYSKRKDWTYKKLISLYLKRKSRQEEIFWNY